MKPHESVLAAIRDNAENTVFLAEQFFTEADERAVILHGSEIITALIQAAHNLGTLNPHEAFKLAFLAAGLTKKPNFIEVGATEQDRLADDAFATMGAICAIGFARDERNQVKHIEAAVLLSRQCFGRKHMDTFQQGGKIGLHPEIVPVIDEPDFWERLWIGSKLLFYAAIVLGIIWQIGKSIRQYQIESAQTAQNLVHERRDISDRVKKFRKQYPQGFERIVSRINEVKDYYLSTNQPLMVLHDIVNFTSGVCTESGYNLFDNDWSNECEQLYGRLSRIETYNYSDHAAKTANGNGHLNHQQVTDIFLQEAKTARKKQAGS